MSYGELGRCVSCGRKLDLYKGDHHCSPTHERKRKRQDRRAREHDTEPPPTIEERLADGFKMIDGQSAS